MARSIFLARRARRIACVAAILGTLPALARAQQPPPKESLDPVTEEAQQEFLAGREAVKKGELGRAVALFKRSQELRPTVGTRLNLASVEEQLGQIASALEHFQTALKQLPENDDRLPVAKEGVARLAPRVPSLKLDRAVGAPSDMSIQLDGRPLAVSAIGLDQPVNPGKYTITTSAPGHEDRRYEVKIDENMHATLAVEAGKSLSVPLIAPPPPPPRSPVQTVGLVLGGVGLAGLGVGAATGILAIVKKGDAAAQCPDAARCNGAGLETAATGRALAGVSTASFVIGLAGVGAGVTLVLVGRDKPASTAQPAGAGSVTATIAPWALPGGAGVGASGRF